MSEADRLDDHDAEILAGVRALHDALDPPPPDLTDRVLFALAAAQVDGEVARLQEDRLVGSGARSSTQRPHTLTFDAHSLTIMVTVTELVGGSLRLDGWLAPAAPLRVELRRPDTSGPAPAVTADDTGRFVFPAVPPGLAQLVVHRDGGEPGTVVTTAVVL
jgi:hypothetical protein